MSPQELRIAAGRLEAAALAAFEASIDARWAGNDVLETRLSNRGRALRDAADRATTAARQAATAEEQS